MYVVEQSHVSIRLCCSPSFLNCVDFLSNNFIETISDWYWGFGIFVRAREKYLNPKLSPLFFHMTTLKKMVLSYCLNSAIITSLMPL